jgi:hypothetical protein
MRNIADDLPSGRAGREVMDTMGDRLARCNSFSADTDVSTPDGDRPISEIQVGDVVYGYNEETGEIGTFEVTNTISHEDPEIAYLVIDGKTIETTPGHPFYTSDGEWVEVKDLELGDLIMNLDLEYGTVESIEIVPQVQVMYDLTVDEVHNFAVGDGAWVVHNADFCLPNGKDVIDYDTFVQRNAARFLNRAEAAAHAASVDNDLILQSKYLQSLISIHPGMGSSFDTTIAVARRTDSSLYVAGFNPRPTNTSLIEGTLVTAQKHSGLSFDLAPHAVSTTKHAEETLLGAFHNIEGVGVGNNTGPCREICRPALDSQSIPYYWSTVFGTQRHVKP